MYCDLCLVLLLQTIFVCVAIQPMHIMSIIFTVIIFMMLLPKEAIQLHFSRNQRMMISKVFCSIDVNSIFINKSRDFNSFNMQT